ncbi:Hypothetical predicted protein [Mytilus galloprovincialis]|nr:Hypothetical predicted protein [Mytilus galloprovincialis]
MIFACIIPYLKSTHDGDVKKDFPYISDTGNKGISASAFSLLFNIYGFLAFINITIRFEQIKVNYSYQKSRPRYIVNIITTVVGLISLSGMALVSTFQDLSIKRKAAILEWILAFLVSFYFLTFIPEFRHYDWRIQLDETNIKSNKVDINSDSIYNVGSK